MVMIPRYGGTPTTRRINLGPAAQTTTHAFADIYRTRMLLAVDAYEDAKVSYAKHKRRYTKDFTGTDLINAEYKAASDTGVKKAIGDAAFYAREAEMYAAVLSALKG